ncbi:deoxynucleoside kinase [Candidatus Pacearchaeota archaeon]|nr:deoxynucleoside kinase [Candidatus Pacearchaeota archaeon]
MIKMKEFVFPRLITIHGVIGVGKSTLLERFSEEDYHKIQEPTDRDEKTAKNPYLEDFSRDPGKWSPEMELYLLSRKRVELEYAIRQHGPIVSDWGETDVFSRLLWSSKVLSDRSYQTYCKVAQFINRYRPGVVIYLSGVEVAFKRCRERGRECEKNLEFSYFVSLHNEYLKYFNKIKAIGARVYEVDNTFDSFSRIQEILEKENLPGLK